MFDDIKLKVVLSYSIRDRYVVDILTNFLNENNCLVYSDVEYYELGETDFDCFKEIIDKADIFMPVLTENFLNTEYTRKELDKAFYLSSDAGLQIVPVTFGGYQFIDFSNIPLYLRRFQYINFDHFLQENDNFVNTLNHYRLKLNIYRCYTLVDDYAKIGNNKDACYHALSIIQYLYSSFDSNRNSSTFYTLVEAINKYLLYPPMEWAYENSKYEGYFVKFKDIIVKTINDYINSNYDYSAENILNIIYHTNDKLYDYVFSEYGVNAQTNDTFANLQVEIIKKYPYLVDVKKKLIDSKYISKKVSGENITLHKAVAEYLYKSNELFALLNEQETQPLDFFACLKMSYERLKDYCGLIGASEIGSLAIEKIQQIDTIINNKEPNSQSTLETASLKAILGIKELEQGEYDVFISHKSEDTEIAAKVYKFLKGNMINPFFDKECLPELGKSEYEEAILGALNNSKHFVIILSNLEYLNSGWVKEEIDTFAQELREGRKDGNLVFVVTSNVMREIITTNKQCLPLKYRKFIIIPINDYQDEIISYLRN